MTDVFLISQESSKVTIQTATVSSVNITVTLEEVTPKVGVASSTVDSVLLGSGIITYNRTPSRVRARSSSPTLVEATRVPLGNITYRSPQYIKNTNSAYTKKYLDSGFTTEDNINYSEKEFLEMFTELNKVNGDVNNLTSNKKKIYIDSYVRNSSRLNNLQKISNTLQNYTTTNRSINRTTYRITKKPNQ